jgi:hypothetical protein
VLTLTSDKYPHREDNRRDILDTLHKLIDEGERAFPQPDPQIRQLQQRRRQAREDVILRGTPPPDYDPLSTRRRVCTQSRACCLHVNTDGQCFCERWN